MDRKGVTAFLRGKVRRLGVPFIFFNHVLGPVWLSFIQAPSLDTAPAFQDYLVPSGGPTWYAGWLLTFCLGYASFTNTEGNTADYNVPCPPVPVFLGVALFNGLWRGYFHLSSPEDIANMTHGT